MIIEILLVILFILALSLFLIFLKTWHIHIILKNNNLDYSFDIKINFLFFNIFLFTIEKIVYLKLQASFFSKTLDIFELKLNDEKSEEIENTSSENEEGTFDKIKQVLPLLDDSKGDLYYIIKLIIKMVKFDESYVILNMGLLENDLTIKLCTLLWALAAPLYPLNFKLYLTPEMNKFLVKSDVNVKFDILLFNLIKILFYILRRDRLRELIKVLTQ
ncbi:hypothetical protein [Methanosphaera sp.]|uniref:hypothetical protein n=1 Tax=Methanosphaera sp. TaxID=2666342 RepID=UPI0025F37F07|nr:hypothetical protein [Methanosphaera sp.]